MERKILTWPTLHIAEQTGDLGSACAQVDDEFAAKAMGRETASLEELRDAARQAINYDFERRYASYSRDQEFEADTLGVRYLTRTNYDPSAMSAFGRFPERMQSMKF